VSKVALWLRWSGRDLRARVLQVAAVATIVALGTGVYAGLTSTASWRRASYDASFAALRVHDLHVSLAQDTYVDASRLREALASITPVAEVETRLVTPVQVDASRDGRTILVPGRLVGTDVTGTTAVDELHVRAGRALDVPDRGADRVALDAHFAEHYDLAPSGRLRLSGGTEVEYVGHVLSPEYFLVMSAEGTMSAQANFAVLFASNDTIGRIVDRPGMANDAVLRLRAVPDRRAAARDVEAALRRSLPGVAATVTALDDERPYRLMYDDIRGDQRVYDIFAFLVLGGAAFAAFNLVGRIVEAQRREIGIGMSLGLPRWKIAVRPLLVGFEVALLGAVVGLAVGLGVGALMLAVMKRFFPLPDWRTPFDAAAYARGWAIGTVLPFAATLVPVVRAVRVAPVDAIRTGPTTLRRRGLVHLAARLNLGNSIREMPFRNVLRAPRRTALTALAIAAAIATLVGVIGMVDSFFGTIDQGERAVLGERPDRVTVGLSGFALRGTPELERITDAPGVGRAEPGLQVAGRMRRAAGGGDDIDALIRLFPFDSALWRPSTTDGALDTTRTGLVIAEKAARDLDVGVGDEIVLEHPRRRGLGYDMVDSRVRIEAVHEIPYRFVAFMDTRDASLMDLDGVYNTVTVEPAPGTPGDDLERTLFGMPGVRSVQPVSDFARTIRDLVSQILDILRVIEGAVLLLAILIAFNSSAISVDERAREHATMFAFGVRLRTVLRNTMIESLVVGVLGTALGIVLGHAIVRYITRFLLPETMPELTVDPVVSPATIVTAVVLGVLAVSLAPLLTARRMHRMDIPATLRVVE
jgi:putative ABC transport system permease protein